MYISVKTINKTLTFLLLVKVTINTQLKNPFLQTQLKNREPGQRGKMKTYCV